MKPLKLALVFLIVVLSICIAFYWGSGVISSIVSANGDPKAPDDAGIGCMPFFDPLDMNNSLACKATLRGYSLDGYSPSNVFDSIAVGIFREPSYQNNLLKAGYIGWFVFLLPSALVIVLIYMLAIIYAYEQRKVDPAQSKMTIDKLSIQMLLTLAILLPPVGLVIGLVVIWGVLLGMVPFGIVWLIFSLFGPVFGTILLAMLLGSLFVPVTIQGVAIIIVWFKD